MSECEPTEPQRMSGEADTFPLALRTIHPQTRFASPARPPAPTGVVSFDRNELRIIFNLYGRKVAEGEWRDYAIDFDRDRAVFSIFRRTSEIPIYTIEKDPRLTRRQGAYSVIAATGLIIKRGHDLARVIAVLDKGLKLVVA